MSQPTSSLSSTLAQSTSSSHQSTSSTTQVPSRTQSITQSSNHTPSSPLPAPLTAESGLKFENSSASPTPIEHRVDDNSSSPTSNGVAHDFSSLPPAQRQLCTNLLNECTLRRSRHQYHEAIVCYDRILELLPTHTASWNGKGQCYKLLKDNVSAVECLQRCLSLDPTDWVAHDHLGMIFKETELFERAMEEYKLAIQCCPAKFGVAHEHLAVVLTDFGTRLKLAGSTEQAVQSYNDALSVHPSYWPAYFNLGVVYSERGNFDKAMEYYLMAVEQNPNYVEALCNIGVIYKNSGQLSFAIEYYERALRANPNFAIANSNLAIALTDMGTQVKNEGRLDEGIEYYKSALHHHSKYPAAWYNLGVAYAEKARYDDAKVCYELAVLFDPKCSEAYNNLGVIYKDRGNLDQAIFYYNEALKANPKFSQTMNNLGVIYTMLGKLDEAHAFCTKAIKTNPLYAEAWNNLGVLYRDEGRIMEAVSSYEECLKIDPLSRNAGQNRLLAMNSISSADDEATISDMIWQAHRQWGINFAKLYERERFTSWPNNLNAARRPLRIGYISADFFTHSVSYFIEAPIAYSDRNITHITCYSNVARRDKKTQHLQNLAHSWRSIHDLNAKQVAELIRKDEIDILVELTGHTAGNRLDVMALKPAPIQVTWIGYPNTTGLPTIDYRFTDEIVDPINTKQQYSEELIRLQGPFLCYTPPSEAPPVSATPALARGYVTFGSFNNLAKVNDRVLNVWCAILKSVPGSRMLIKCKPFASSNICAKMWKRFAELGIDSDRVDLVSLLPTTAEHLDSYSNIDISVDTFPYAGTTTTCEALYSGVPVVTYQKVTHPNHAHNVGATLLSRIPELQFLIAKSEEEYISLAVSLANDIPRLQSLRQRIRPAMMSSPICDGVGFVKNLTNTYLHLWQKYCNKQTNQ